MQKVTSDYFIGGSFSFHLLLTIKVSHVTIKVSFKRGKVVLVTQNSKVPSVNSWFSHLFLTFVKIHMQRSSFKTKEPAAGTADDEKRHLLIVLRLQI